MTFCHILFSAFGFKLHRFVDCNRNSRSLRRYERIHGRMHIVQKVPRAFSNWQAAFSGSQGTLVLSVPQEHHVYNLQNIRLFLSKWSVCGQQKKKQNGWLTADIQKAVWKDHPKFLSSFCCPYFIQNLYDFIIHSFYCFCPYNSSQWGPKLHYCKKLKQQYCLRKKHEAYFNMRFSRKSYRFGTRGWQNNDRITFLDKLSLSVDTKSLCCTKK